MHASPILSFYFHTDTVLEVLRHNDQRGMSRQEIVSNTRILLTAGSETIATLLSGATYYLLQNPTILHRVQSEVRTVFKNEDEITLRSVSTPHLLPYLEAVLQESLRCYPPIPATLPRVTGSQGAVIDGKFVPRNVRRIFSSSHTTVKLTYPDLCRR